MKIKHQRLMTQVVKNLPLFSNIDIKPMSTPAPVVLIRKAGGCPFCTILDGMMPKIKAALKSVASDVRIIEIYSEDRRGEYDTTKYPASIGRLTGFFPITMYIPGVIWDAAMVNPELLLTIEDGIIIKGGQWSPERQMTVGDPTSEFYANTEENFRKWFQMCLSTNQDLVKAPKGLLVYNTKESSDLTMYNIASLGDDYRQIKFS